MKTFIIALLLLFSSCSITETEPFAINKAYDGLYYGLLHDVIIDGNSFTFRQYGEDLSTVTNTINYQIKDFYHVNTESANQVKKSYYALTIQDPIGIKSTHEYRIKRDLYDQSKILSISIRINNNLFLYR